MSCGGFSLLQEKFLRPLGAELQRIWGSLTPTRPLSRCLSLSTGSSLQAVLLRGSLVPSACVALAGSDQLLCRKLASSQSPSSNTAQQMAFPPSSVLKALLTAVILFIIPRKSKLRLSHSACLAGDCCSGSWNVHDIIFESPGKDFIARPFVSPSVPRNVLLSARPLLLLAALRSFAEMLWVSLCLQHTCVRHPQCFWVFCRVPRCAARMVVPPLPARSQGTSHCQWGLWHV